MLASETTHEAHEMTTYKTDVLVDEKGIVHRLHLADDGTRYDYCTADYERWPCTSVKAAEERDDAGEQVPSRYCPLCHYDLSLHSDGPCETEDDVRRFRRAFILSQTPSDESPDWLRS